jgi:pimeloyl-ACP methyl ester carboxylesterase
VTPIKSISVLAILACLPTLSCHPHVLWKHARSFLSDDSQEHPAAGKIKLLTPTGPFSIGTKIYDWVDNSRTEQANHKPGEFRQLIVQVWYPAKDSAGSTAAYVPKLEAYRHVWDDEQVEVASRVLTHAHLNDKPLSGTQFPIVLFSHGWEGTRTEYTSVAEDLASHGYAVFGIDHPYMGRIALSNGQVTEATESQFRSPGEIRQYYGRDVKFVIDQISKLNGGDPEDVLTGRLKMSLVGAIGHSSGFVAAGAACAIDHRITACVNVDAPGFSANDLRGLKQPLLWIRLERAGPVPAEFLRNRSGPVYEVQFMNAKHGSMEDWDYLEAESYQRRTVAAERLQVLRKYLDAFLRKYLKGKESDLLEQKPANQDITIKIYAAR